MAFDHAPVLPRETIEALTVRPGGIYVDGTLGGGGHARLIAERLGGRGTLIGIDRDKDALSAAEQTLANYDCEKVFVHSMFAEIKKVLNELDIEKIDGALLDIGVSSYQLDAPDRGFSYMQDAPLDMRMDQSGGMTAEEIVNTYSEDELTEIIKRYGEERWARRIAAFIVKEREKIRITSSARLVEIIKNAIPARARRQGSHPAKRTFQALRIEVNDELGQLERALDDFMDVLAPGGRLAVITFHSLEDRIVKDAFNKRADPCTCPPEFPVCVCGKIADIDKVTGKPVTAGDEELEINPRSRSAKLRVIAKRG